MTYTTFMNYGMQNKARVLIYIISYNHETLLTKVLDRIPDSLVTHPLAVFEILISEDCSKDDTFRVGYDFLKKYKKLPTTILSNPVNLGFGGNQKLGYHYAIEKGYDFVILLHGDGQYAPELLPELIEPLLKGEAEAVFGSRMLNPKDALLGGMPRYKWIGNKILTKIENFIVGGQLSEWHSGLRLYSVKALKKIPYIYNSDYFDFDTDIIIQFIGSNFRIKELPIPTFYGDEVCSVNGVRYGLKIILSCLLFRAQDLGIFFHPKFYLRERYEGEFSRADFNSSVTQIIDIVRNVEGKILVICENDRQELVRELKKLPITIISVSPNEDFSELLKAHVDLKYVIFLDTLESVPNTEHVLKAFHESNYLQDLKFIAVGANIGFCLIRLMLLLGQFNYGVRGILDFRHRRFFTFSSIKRLLVDHGFKISHIGGIPVPFRLALKNEATANFLSKLNSLLIKIAPSLFSYQYLIEFSPLPNLKQLLVSAKSNTDDLIAKIAEKYDD
jgi:glycosyltransferase involved in cell wall biosynthesis